MTKYTKPHKSEYRPLYRNKSFYIDWECSKCNYTNFEIRGHCKDCGERRHYKDTQIVKVRKSRERDRRNEKPRSFYKHRGDTKRVKGRNSKVSINKWRKPAINKRKKPKKLITSVNTWHCKNCNRKHVNINTTAGNEDTSKCRFCTIKEPTITDTEKFWHDLSGVDISTSKATPKKSTVVPDDPRDGNIFEEDIILSFTEEEIADIREMIRESKGDNFDMRCTQRAAGNPGVIN